MTNAIVLKNIRCLPPMIPNICAKYKTNMWRTIWVICDYTINWIQDQYNNYEGKEKKIYKKNVKCSKLLNDWCNMAEKQ